MKYAVVFERAKGNFSAYVPDLPGCVATGATREEVSRSIREAICFLLEGAKRENLWSRSSSGEVVAASNN